MALGITDGPADTDHLGIAPYYKGLADFIQGCPTPMTIAFQGDWGTGKTSAMKMVQQRLRPQGEAAESGGGPLKVVEFNTWQYSQFDLGEQLVFTLLRAILAELAPPEKFHESREFLKKVGVMAAGAVSNAARMVLSTAGGTAGQTVIALADGAVAAVDNSPGESLVAQLVDVRREFAELVMTHVNLRGDGTFGANGRVVVFVDDLDRLPPERAIEVMEALKTLFDCEGCVFVLAIDFDVVKRGVRLKYGDDMDDTKARAYFDKFIQVPFQMPVTEYETDRLLKASLDGLGLNKKDAARFTQLTLLSIGANPRSLKRLLNTYILLSRVAHARSKTRKNSAQTFALLALEAAYPGLHDEVRSAVDTTGLRDLLSSAAGAPDEAGVVREPSDWGVDRAREGAFRAFAALLQDVLGDDADVAEELRRTSVTSVRGRRTVEVVTDPTLKAARAAAAGIDAARVNQAGRLEEMLERELRGRGAGFESALRSKPDWWHWYVLPPNLSKKRSWGQLVFAPDGALRLYCGASGMPVQQRDPLERKLVDLARARGWRLETSETNSYFRLNGIGSADDLDALVPLLADCALLTPG